MSDKGEDTRFGGCLAGVLIDVETDQVTISAACGKGLARIKRPALIDGTKEDRIVLPPGASGYLRCLEQEEVSLGKTDRILLSLNGNPRVSLRLLNDQFPNLNELIVPGETKVRVQLEQLALALQRAVAVREPLGGASLEVTDKLLLETEGLHGTASRDLLEAEIEGPNTSVRVDAHKLLTGLKNIKDQDKVEIVLSDYASPVLVNTNQDFMFMILPIVMQ